MKAILLSSWAFEGTRGMMRKEDWMKIFLPMWLANVFTLVGGLALEWPILLVIVTAIIWSSLGICVWFFSEKKEVEMVRVEVRLKYGMMSILYHFRNRTKDNIRVHYHVIRIFHKGTPMWQQGYEKHWILKSGKKEQIFESERKKPEEWKIGEEGEYFVHCEATYTYDGMNPVISSNCVLNWPGNK